MTKKKPEGILIREELAKEIERLKALLPTKHPYMSKEDWKFAVNQANAKFRTKTNLKIRHLGSKTSSKGLGETINELQARLDSVDTHLGKRYLTKGSRKPPGFKTWSYKQDSSEGMINPDYNEEFDPKFQARQRRLASQDFHRSTDLSTSNPLAIDQAKNTAIQKEVPNVPNAKNNELVKDKPPASSTVQATLKSDVFTLDKDGKMLGVMTRSQRRAWEKNNQQLLIDRQSGIDSQTGKSIPKIEDRSYYNRGELLRIGSG